MIWEIDERTPTIEGLDADGRPDPAYATALGLVRAPFGRRSLAFIIDVAMWVLVQLPLLLGALPLLVKLATGALSPYGFVHHPQFVLAVVMAAVSFVLSLVLVVVQLVLHGRKGRTFGKTITGIRTVDVRRLDRPGVGAVLLRFVVFAASGIVPVLGPVFLLVSPTFDPEARGRGLHDRAARVWLVDIRRGLNPYDQKRMRIARKVVIAEPGTRRAALPSLATPADPSATPAYLPGGRVSAGVLGMARPHEAHDRQAVGLSIATAPDEPAPVETGRPVLGGYRRAEPTEPPSGSGPAPAPAAPEPAPAAPEPAPAAAPEPAHAPVLAPVPEPVPEPQIPPRLLLRLDSGETIPITEPVLLGRNPDAGGHPGARAVALADDSRSLSKTHLLVRPAGDALEIVDCHSTNGSGLIRGGTEYPVTAGAPVTATVGDTIRLGDRTATVVRA